MAFVSKYTAKKPDQAGLIDYTDAEHQVWRQLFTRQMNCIPNRACDEFILGLQLLDLNAEKIPQLPIVSEQLKPLTGWSVNAVEALISPKTFFQLLANRQFPAATFIRSMEELDYVTEPDIFHELFGHCPLLTQPIYADFIQAYAEYVLSCDQDDWALLQRLFWYTVEFGLIKTPAGCRAYGGGILSSFGETPYCVESDVPQRKPFDVLDAFRTPYRIDLLQTVYYVINDFQQLYDILKLDLTDLIAQARSLGEFDPTFPVDLNNPAIHIHCC